MKVKGAKKEKPVGQGLVQIKKTNTDIQKAKKPKGALKQSTAKVAATNGAEAAPVKIPEKRVFSMKLQPNKPAKEKKPAGVKKSKQENLPPTKRENGAAPAKAAMKQKKPKEGVPAVADDQPKAEISKAKKGKKKSAASIKAMKKNERKLGGKIAEKCTEETLALLPDTLISKQSFQKIYETFRKKGDDKGNKLFGDELKYSMQLISVKVPRCPARNVRVALPHPVLHAEDEVCLIVKDASRGRAVDFLPTLHDWEDKLKELDIGYKVQIIPFQQLKRDYGSFEMKRKLAQRYERFFVDARICGHVFAFLGSLFVKRCKNPIAVKLENEAKIKDVLQQALHLQTYRQGNTGISTEIKFAVHWMPVDHAVENGMALLEQFKTIHPGGWLNIQSINIATATEKSQSLPIYVSTIDPNLVPVPVVVGTREKFVKKQQKLIKKSTGGKYEVTKEGVVRKARAPGDAEESDVELEELELETDDNWVPYDDEPQRQRRQGKSSSARQRGPKMRVK